jgi:hypothetical protein
MPFFSEFLKYKYGSAKLRLKPMALNAIQNSHQKANATCLNP